MVLARQGPETGTGATSGDDDVEAGDLKLLRGVECQLGAGGTHGGELGGRVDARQLGRANKRRVVVGRAAEAEGGQGVVAAVLGVLLKRVLDGVVELESRHRIDNQNGKEATYSEAVLDELLHVGVGGA